MRVRDTMTNGFISAFEDQDVTEAARLMEENQIRRLPIMNRDHKLVGIVSLGDLAVQVGDKQLSGQTLEEVSKPDK
jgi:CBS domain-containing protein